MHKDMVLGLLREQLQICNQDTHEVVRDDPRAWDIYQENTAVLIAAIKLMEEYEWQEGNHTSSEDDNE